MAITAAGDTFQYLQGPLSDVAKLVVVAGEYPPASTPITASSGNVAAAAATATLAGAANVTTYITGFEFTSAGSTAAAVVTITITGTVSGTLSYTYASVAGATLANQPLIVQFSPPIPASAANTSIVVSCPSLGAGNTNATMVAHGYRR
jgi:hypothetical protein